MKYFLLFLVFLNVGFALVNYINPPIPATTYVLTPMVDILPTGSPIGEDEKELLLSELKNQPEARDMQQAYARLGATLSLHDIIQGIHALEKSETPLNKKQRKKVEQFLIKAQEIHNNLRDTQRDILDVERALAEQLLEFEAVDGSNEME